MVYKSAHDLLVWRVGYARLTIYLNRYVIYKSATDLYKSGLDLQNKIRFINYTKRHNIGTDGAPYNNYQLSIRLILREPGDHARLAPNATRLNKRLIQRKACVQFSAHWMMRSREPLEITLSWHGQLLIVSYSRYGTCI